MRIEFWAVRAGQFAEKDRYLYNQSYEQIYEQIDDLRMLTAYTASLNGVL